jgi:hypothetical protein
MIFSLTLLPASILTEDASATKSLFSRPIVRTFPSFTTASASTPTATVAAVPPTATKSIHYEQSLRCANADDTDDADDADADADEHGDELPVRYAAGAGYASERYATS